MLQGRACSRTPCQSVQMRFLHLRHGQLPQGNSLQHKIASIQTASWSDSHERGSETKAPHSTIPVLWLSGSSALVPAAEMAAPSEEAAIRCSFMSWQKNLFFYSAPELACHIYRSCLSLCPSGASGGAQTLTQLLDVLLTLGPPIDWRHKFKPPAADSHLSVTGCWGRTGGLTGRRLRLPELIEAEIQPPCKMAICESKEFWDVFAIMSNEGNLQEKGLKD